jgi:TM2 domain-containing membrane protein YozV
METEICEGVKKNKLTALLLCLFFGFLGVHRFYAGQGASGGIMLFLGGTFCLFFTLGSVVPFGMLAALIVWVLVDFVLVLCHKMQDATGREISN